MLHTPLWCTMIQPVWHPTCSYLQTLFSIHLSQEKSNRYADTILWHQRCTTLIMNDNGNPVFPQKHSTSQRLCLLRTNPLSGPFELWQSILVVVLGIMLRYMMNDKLQTVGQQSLGFFCFSDFFLSHQDVYFFHTGVIKCGVFKKYIEFSHNIYWKYRFIKK